MNINMKFRVKRTIWTKPVLYISIRLLDWNLIDEDMAAKWVAKTYRVVREEAK